MLSFKLISIILLFITSLAYIFLVPPTNLLLILIFILLASSLLFLILRLSLSYKLSALLSLLVFSALLLQAHGLLDLVNATLLMNLFFAIYLLFL
ncbi:hypothetical protein HYW87_00930 [Candidatus Roizmanbacteria bacterium]|nr:hypothetical protein [Candidatus Roizmanbacteria bacterium]